MVANVCEVGKVVEDRWCELLDRGFMIRTVLEFPRSMYYKGHPHKRLRVNTFYRYENRITISSVEEFCDGNQPYEKFAKSQTSQESPLKIHLIIPKR